MVLWIRASCARNRGIRPNRNPTTELSGRIQRFIWLPLPFLALSVAGCSITAPITSLRSDDEISTGSVTISASPISPKLSSEDWRRAKSALGVALDPQGNGLPVKWENPETKRHGSFAAAGNFVVRNDFVCRPFTATLAVDDVETSPSGLACRKGPNDWDVAEEHHPVPPSAHPPKLGNAAAPKAGGIF